MRRETCRRDEGYGTVMTSLGDDGHRDGGADMHRLMTKLYPISRSITGDGVRKTLRILQEYIPIEIREVPSGTRVFDWTVPREWNIRDAYVKNSQGVKVIDFAESNLHVLNYSAPVRANMRLKELREHCYTIPEHPDWIPYRTSYYREQWGFCLEHNRLLAMEDGEYEVVIDSTLEDGHLTYGEYVIEGREQAEVLLSCHICHPSLCNDNLSGIALAVFLARRLSRATPRFSHRFVFIPGTIGSITWLSLNERRLDKIKHGLVIACVGDGGKFTYKKTRQGDAGIDRAVMNVLRDSGMPYEVTDFIPFGYDERQYCSPGFNLPVGCLMRTPHGKYPEYHTSADNLAFVKPEHLEESFAVYCSVLSLLDGDRIFINLNPKCEPQLGRRGLYQVLGGGQDGRQKELALLWVLNLSDGAHSLLEISERSGMPFAAVHEAASLLRDNGLLRECS